MSDFRFYKHLLFNKERHLFPPLLFSLIITLLLVFTSALTYTPIEKSLLSSTMMDQDAVILQRDCYDLDCHNLKEAQEYSSSIAKEGENTYDIYTDKVKNYEFYYQFVEEKNSLRYHMYVPRNSNINNLGQFTLLEHPWDSNSTSITFLGDKFKSTSDNVTNFWINDPNISCILHLNENSTLTVYNNPETWIFATDNFTTPVKLNCIFVVVHFQEVSFKQSCYIQERTKEGTEIFDSYPYYEKASSKYKSLSSILYYTYDSIERNIAYIIISLIAVFTLSIACSKYMNLKKRKEILDALFKMGLRRKNHILFESITSAFYALLGYILALVLTIIGQGVFKLITGYGFLNPFSLLYSFLVVILLSVAYFLATLVFDMKN